MPPLDALLLQEANEWVKKILFRDGMRVYQCTGRFFIDP